MPRSDSRICSRARNRRLRPGWTCRWSDSCGQNSLDVVDRLLLIALLDDALSTTSDGGARLPDLVAASGAVGREAHEVVRKHSSQRQARAATSGPNERVKDTLGLRLMGPLVAEISWRRSSWDSSTTHTSARIRLSAVRRPQRSTSDEHPCISRQSRLRAAGRANARWTHRFESSISMQNGYCRCWIKEQLEGRSRRSAKGLERVAACTLSPRTTTNPLVCARQPASQFPLRPYPLLHQRLDTVAVALPRPLEGDQRIACGTRRLDEAPEDVTVLGLVLHDEVLCGSHRRTRKRRVDLPRVPDPALFDRALATDGAVAVVLLDHGSQGRRAQGERARFRRLGLLFRHARPPFCSQWAPDRSPADRPRGRPHPSPKLPLSGWTSPLRADCSPFHLDVPRSSRAKSLARDIRRSPLEPRPPARQQHA